MKTLIFVKKTSERVLIQNLNGVVQNGIIMSFHGIERFVSAFPQFIFKIRSAQW